MDKIIISNQVVIYPPVFKDDEGNTVVCIEINGSGLYLKGEEIKTLIQELQKLIKQP